MSKLQWITLHSRTNVGYYVDLGSGQDIPSARVQFDTCKVSNSSKTGKVILELGEEDLEQLYATFETIQLRLDNIVQSREEGL